MTLEAGVQFTTLSGEWYAKLAGPVGPGPAGLRTKELGAGAQYRRGTWCGGV